MEKAVEKNLQDTEVKEAVVEEAVAKEAAAEGKQALDEDQIDQVSGGLTISLVTEDGKIKESRRWKKISSIRSAEP